METIITEMKNTLKGINSRLDKADQISNLEDKITESTRSEQQKARGWGEKKMRIV